MQLPPTIPQWFGTAKNKDVRSLIRSHRSLVRLLHTARFAHALRFALSFTRSLIRSLARVTV